MSGQQSHQWSPIEDLPENWRPLANPQVEALVSAWLSQADELRQGSSYNNFLVKMRREWAIETGVIERLYRISDGATKTLIEQGLDAALLLHEDVDRSPDEVIAIINDQYHAIEGLYQFVSGDRELSGFYIRQLHQVLTAHQPTYEAIDTLGNRVVRELPRGVWKNLPNNVGDPEGDYYFEFCPPEHVESEIERLLQMHREHEKDEVPPDIEAAWLHHRFTLIHPFTDGNGRVARCLASLVLLKARWFPLVVTRRDASYIGSIRDADRGNLKPLVDLFGTLQSRAVTKAFSLSEELDQKTRAISTILGAVRDKLERSQLHEDPEKQKVISIGTSIFDMAWLRLQEVAAEVNEAILSLGPRFEAECFHGRNFSQEPNSFNYAIQKCIDYLALPNNYRSYQAWVRLEIRTHAEHNIVISLHSLGKEFSGVLGAIAFLYTAPWEATLRMSPPNVIIPLCEIPFLFTYAEAEQDVIERFRPWLEERLILGLDQWRKNIGA